MKQRLYKLVVILAIFSIFNLGAVRAENGYNLWLRYLPIENVQLRQAYQRQLSSIAIYKHSPTIDAALKELINGINQMIGKVPNISSIPGGAAINFKTNRLVLAKLDQPAIAAQFSTVERRQIGQEGYLIKTIRQNRVQQILIAANTDIGLLYGSFHLLKLMQTHQSLQALNIQQWPRLKLRILDHWDNLNGTVERGYAGYSLWNWQTLPGIIQKRYIDYARANASIGINGAVLNNVNASVKSLTREYLIKTAALAKAFKPYGIKVYLTAKFSAPKELGHLKTADPLDPAVIKWWQDKVKEIYHYIPNFGGFLVKASSEGQPGPGDYGRTHADGANMMAAALKPYGGIVMWRTFVYENKKGADRAKQGYEEFKPLDGKFADNVLLQAKYGPIDFQPREAFNPLFGAMPHTHMMMEFQITQEYFGFATHLVYLGSLFQEYLRKDTYQKGPGTTIAKVLEERVNPETADSNRLTGIAGVANIGTDVNWCGHPFGQANWYAFGRFAWNPMSSADSIAEDWLKMTFTNDPGFVNPIKKLMLGSREVAVNYMTPLGLSHIMNFATHYGPGPWSKFPGWDARDYHHADSVGIGLDRTATGSDAVSQYAPALAAKYSNLKTTPLNLILWFHHIGWDQKIATGETMWNSLVHYYYKGVKQVAAMQQIWQSMKGKIDEDRFNYVTQLLKQQHLEAKWWRNGCVLYFQQYSKRPLPKDCKEPGKAYWNYPTFKPDLPFPYHLDDQ
ncbi:alpha-glucuronidase family glycosyl hydrolase [Arachidicoccus ginsenosidivorans]|uniref:Xylan alpha-1,2-glucuronidase n=1 Tax=Arachidicoccus ginsenosidivorans TaxID=496057 RepID=A0A5B8VR18_9BACT|nr:alpha-glucuronidase family glycosyl hydrolase [Arachidicoccus ginsenosidivorans]QEC73531.1 alpha-glucuronidase [Arachidicoccus ginsenosidivorans]